MKTTMVSLVAVAGMLLGVPAVVGTASSEPEKPGVACKPGTGECGAPELLEETAPQAAELENRHPCDWVETCQLPCGREGGECCHAEWNCPPDANLPRC